MDVHGSSGVPAGIYGCEPGDAVGAGQLIAAQKSLSDRGLSRHVGVDASRVAVPDIDLRAAKGGAPARAHPRHLESEVEGHAVSLRSGGRIGRDIGPIEPLVHENMALRSRPASRRMPASRPGLRSAWYQ